MDLNRAKWTKIIHLTNSNPTNFELRYSRLIESHVAHMDVFLPICFVLL